MNAEKRLKSVQKIVDKFIFKVSRQPHKAHNQDEDCELCLLFRKLEEDIEVATSPGIQL